LSTEFRKGVRQAGFGGTTGSRRFYRGGELKKSRLPVLQQSRPYLRGTSSRRSGSLSRVVWGGGGGGDFTYSFGRGKKKKNAGQKKGGSPKPWGAGRMIEEGMKSQGRSSIEGHRDKKKRGSKLQLSPRGFRQSFWQKRDHSAGIELQGRNKKKSLSKSRKTTFR